MAATPRRIVLVHGFTQTRTSWRPAIEALTPQLPTGTEVLAVDLPGHGNLADLHLDLTAGATHLARKILDTGAAALVVGYSLGGRLALRLALDHPEATAGLILIGATAGIDDPAERAARRVADEQLADRIEAEGVALFLETWLALPLFEGFVPEPDDLAARRANTPAGLAASLRLAGTATMDPPWWDELHRIDVPTTILWGEHDAKFSALGARLAAGIGPNASTGVIAGAGHAAHLANPTAVATLIERIAAAI